MNSKVKNQEDRELFLIKTLTQRERQFYPIEGSLLVSNTCSHVLTYTLAL